MTDEAVERLAEPIEGQGAEIVAPPGFLRALGCNLLAGLESLVFRRTVATRVSGSVPQVLALVLIGIAAAFANDFWQTGPDGAPNPEGLAGLLFGQPFLLLSAWAVARLARAEGRVLAGMVVLEALWLLLDLVVIGFTYLPEPLWNRIGGPLNLPFWTVYAWGMVASCVALVRVTGLEARRAWAAALAISVFLLLPTMFVNPERRLWLPPQYLDEDEASSKARASESVLYGEQDLLEDTLEAIQPGRPGLPGFFLVALGGTGSQDVFMREVTEVQSLFDTRFDTKGRSVVLLNNPATLSRYPIASMTALRRTLEVVGDPARRGQLAEREAEAGVGRVGVPEALVAAEVGHAGIDAHAGAGADQEPVGRFDQRGGAVQFMRVPGHPSRRFSIAASRLRMCSPTAMRGSEWTSPSAVSRSAIRWLATANACSKECVCSSASANIARPKKVQSASWLQPCELRSARDAVITSVSGPASGSTKPPE